MKDFTPLDDLIANLDTLWRFDAVNLHALREMLQTEEFSQAILEYACYTIEHALERIRCSYDALDGVEEMCNKEVTTS